MDYHVALSPELDLSPEKFAAAWNEAPECRALAEAELVFQPAQGFPLDPQMAQQGLILLAGIAGSLALDALKEAVKGKLTEFFEEKLSGKTSIEVDAIRQPGGAYLLVVTGEA
ncbi:MAG: hypothetical protein ACETWB_04825 [Anaerolineae bacterium]